jgi:DNA polymerase (family 10)
MARAMIAKGARPGGATAPRSLGEPKDNAFVADRLDEIADLLEVQDANPFRVRAYRNAARTVRRYGVPIIDMVMRGPPLTDLPGIGEDLAGKITDCVTSGTTALLTDLRRTVPGFVVELLDFPGIGPKRATKLWRDLGIRSPEQLKRAVLDGRIAAARGLGKAVQALVSEALDKRTPTGGRVPLILAAPVANELAAHMRAGPGILSVALAGSLRRGRETVGDVDLLVTAPERSSAAAWFCSYPGVARVLARGETRATVVLQSGLQVDLRVVTPHAYGSALQYLTGSKAHSIALRRLAMERDQKLNEYGVFDKTGRRLAGETEDSVYAALGLPFIEPELRENRGEIEAAREGKLPLLVNPDEIRGDLHVHCRFDDHLLADAMCRAALARGYSYLGLTDSAARLAPIIEADGSSFEMMLRRLSPGAGGLRVLRVVECDIEADGRLALPDALRASCDIVIAAVHSRFELARAEQTRRVLAALEDPDLRILSHPSRRLVARDAPYDLDMQSVIRAAGERGIWIEIAADPARLDVGDLDCRAAREAGALVSVSSEATTPEGLADITYALLQARRGWLERPHVVNTLPWRDLSSLLTDRRTRRRRRRVAASKPRDDSEVARHQ